MRVSSFLPLWDLFLSALKMISCQFLASGVLALSLSLAPRSLVAQSSKDVSPANWLERALEAYLQERYDDSIDLFQKVLAYDRKNETALKGLSSAQEQKRSRQERLEAKERPALLAAERFYRRGEFVLATDRLQDILSRIPDHPKARRLVKKTRKKVQKRFGSAKFQSSDWFYYKGLLAYLERDWFQAIQAWEKVYAFNPDHVLLVTQMNMAKQNLEEQQKRERLALYQGVAWDSLRQKKYAEAVNAWKEVLRLDPDNSEALEGIKQTQEAASQDLALKRQENIEMFSRRAMDAYIEREYSKSLRLWDNVLELDADNSLANEYIKRIRTRSKDKGYYSSIPDSPADSDTTGGTSSGYEKAKQLLNDNRYPEAIESLERHLRRHSEDSKAKDLLQEAQGKQTDQAEKAYKEGLVSYSQGDSEQAIKKWQETLRMDPNYQKARQALIKALAESRKKRR